MFTQKSFFTAALVFAASAVVFSSLFFLLPKESEAVLTSKQAFTVDEAPVSPTQGQTFQVAGDGHNRAGGDLRDLPYDFSTVPPHLWQQLNQAMRPNSGVLCMNMIIDRIMSYATFDPPQCAATNICSGGINGGNVVNSCTGAVVQTCPNGCSGGTCNPDACVPRNICSGGTYINSCTGAVIGGVCGSAAISAGGSSTPIDSPEIIPQEPQCSDNLDNDGDGFTDSDDEDCSNPSDNNEFSILPDPAALSLSAPAFVHANATALVVWSVGNVEDDSCTLTGTNGDSWALDGSSGTRTSSGLSGETTFTLSCTGLDGDNASVAATVRILPSFEEI
jgi:hypothetical protein